MESLRKILTGARLLPDLVELLGPREPCYLVGGALRDWLLGREVTDFDVATPGDPTDLAQRFAGRVGGKWFLMDRQRRQSRVVVKGQGRIYDFAPFRAPDLEADLRLRDFTVNAMALPLVLDGAPEPLDPLGGRRDLAQGRLRACAEWVFYDDPLRVLKGVRHCAELGLCLEEETFRRMREAVALLDRVAPERIRAELAAVFAAPLARENLPLLQALGLDRQLFGPPDSEEGFERGVRLAERAEEVTRRLAGADAAVASFLVEEVEAGLSRTTLLKLAAFLRGYALADPSAFCFALRLSRRAAALLPSIVALEPLPLDRLAPFAATGRGRALWAESLGPGPGEVVIFLAVLAEVEPERAAEAILPLLRDMRETAVEGRIPDLVDGRWLCEELGLCQGPAVGQALARLRAEEVAGRVKNAQEARKFLESLDKKIVDNETGDTL
jgi:poly(A) polymerase